MIKIETYFNGKAQNKAFNESLKRFDTITLTRCIKACSLSENPFYVDFAIVDARVIEMLAANGLIMSKSVFSRKKKRILKFSKWEIYILKRIEISFLNYARGLIVEFKRGNNNQIITN